MNYEEYIEEITNLIEANINRLNSRSILKNPHYGYSSRNYFELSHNEYEKLNDIVKKIYLKGDFKHKFPKSFIFDKLVKEVIINSYDLNSTTDIIKLNLKDNFERFEEILNEELKDWICFIPISGLIVEKDLNFNSMTICTFETFKNEIVDYYERNPSLLKYKHEYEHQMELVNDLKHLCFVKLTVNGTKETSRDKALNKINELLSIFSLYKSYDTNGFGIIGEVLPLDSQITTYLLNEDRLNVLHRRSVRNKYFNLTQHLDYMKNHYLDYFIDLINKEELNYVEKILLNSIQWYYESVKREFILNEDVVTETLNSNAYYEHYNYFKLGTNIMNLISALESLLIPENYIIKSKLRKDRFNLIMKYENKTDDTNYYKYLNELYKLRNDIAHSNKEKSLIKFNINTYTSLINMFIVKFVEIKIDFDNNPEKSLNTKDDLNNYYNGKNRLN